MSDPTSASSVSERLMAIVKAYDVRGLAPEQFDEDIAARLGAAFARFVADEDPTITTIAVGRDMRPTGIPLGEAFREGVCSQGLDVIDLGMISTDMLYFASGSLNVPGAVLTASHNPAQYNGIKMCRAGAVPIGAESGLYAIRDLASEGVAPNTDREPGSVEHRDMLDAFADHAISFVDTAKLRPLKVIADTANGMGGLVVPVVFDRLPFDLEILYPELDGTFPNHPADPLQPENLRDLQARVLDTGADIGLAFDGDADRVFIVDEKAQPVPGSLTTAMVAANILDKNPGETILYNLICSKSVPAVIEERGGTSERTRVGHSYIKARMAETGAIFAGEHSGHYYYRDNWRADSGLITALVVLEMLSAADAPLSELRKPFERYAASGEINTVVDDQAKVLAAVEAAYPDATIDHLDGLTVDSGDWWFNLRASNTEPLLRLNLEAPDEDQVALRVAEVQKIMAG